ncbi:glycosyltransferase family 2 protein [Ectobacillus sp. JY-23]|uniref:glycosyltransferase n=1 Tax=Ectobacillus sp. JY-23 TaxID=2933872 RepID=UPI001FF19A31|nr:glycosyltransferase family 2 protein [Ectobacillus sp. JY-23]UOY93111.1 glycosyltransferase family 2 protein [Ectobacillus sp. JY-23]
MFLIMIVSVFIGVMLLAYIPDCVRRRSLIEVKNVTIIIPARNEERNIGRLLMSLQDQMYPHVEVLVMDDGSTDETAVIAKRMGANVISLPPLPSGWQGKAWGCWNGAKMAQGEILIFLDADTVLEGEGIRHLIATYYECRATVLSVHPYHRMVRPYEFFSSFFHLLLFSALRAFHMFGNKQKAIGAFGQCLICKRGDYFKFGGHLAGKGELLENMTLAQRVLQAGGKVACVSGRGAISMRMYPEGFKTFVEGWSKSFAKGASGTNPWLLLWIGLWMNGIVTSCLHLGEQGVFVFYMLFVAQVYWMLRRIGNFGIITALTYPLHVMVFLLVFALSCIKLFVHRNVSWKGRTISTKKE